MRPGVRDQLAVVAAVAVLGVGCAHRSPAPFASSPDILVHDYASPPGCFAGPLEDWIADPIEITPVERLASPWNGVFVPDVSHRICRGDRHARQRWLDAARGLDKGDPRGRSFFELLGRCTAPEYCGWALDRASDVEEAAPVREMLFESAWRWCSDSIDRTTFERAASGIGVSVADKAPWITRSDAARCRTVPRHDDPWLDLTGLHESGCLDLGRWVMDHLDSPDATAAALERCVQDDEVRYQEASCLRELAGLNRDRAADLVRAHLQRGWGISSPITRYARTLMRFPDQGRLEAELTRLGLLASGPAPPAAPGKTPVLPEEVLELSGRLLSFTPACSERYCEHAPLMYQLIDLVSPHLDEVVLVERWPALEKVDLGDGPHRVSTAVGGIPVPLNVSGGPDGAFDRGDHDRLRDAVAVARQQPHLLTAYFKNRAYRLNLRYLDGWYDLEVLLAGLDTMLADNGSDLRYAAVDAHCVPCSKVVAGPFNGLIEAAFGGLLEVTDPFNDLWTRPGFEIRHRTDER